MTLRAEAAEFTPPFDCDATALAAAAAAAATAAATHQQMGEMAAADSCGIEAADMEMWTQSCDYAWKCAAAAAAGDNAVWGYGAGDDFSSTAVPSPSLDAEDAASWVPSQWGYEADYDAAAAAFAAAWCTEAMHDSEAFVLPDAGDGHGFVLDGMEGMDGMEEVSEEMKAYLSGMFPHAYFGGDVDLAAALAALPPGLEPPPGLGEALDGPPGLEALGAPPGLEGSYDQDEEYGAVVGGEAASPAALETTSAEAGLADVAADEPSTEGQGTDDEQEAGAKEDGPTGADASQSLPEGCTTVMLRNIPNKYTQDKLMDRLREDGFGCDIDFLYLPVDFRNKCNVGYVFLNFRTEDACRKFHRAYHGVNSWEKLPGFRSKKVCEVSPARCHGREENVKRLQSSPVMIELSRHPDWLPMVFDDSGKQLEFPVPQAARDKAQAAAAKATATGSGGSGKEGGGGSRGGRASRRSRA